MRSIGAACNLALAQRDQALDEAAQAKSLGVRHLVSSGSTIA